MGEGGNVSARLVLQPSDSMAAKCSLQRERLRLHCGRVGAPRESAGSGEDAKCQPAERESAEGKRLQRRHPEAPLLRAREACRGNDGCSAEGDLRSNAPEGPAQASAGVVCAKCLCCDA